MADFKPVGKVSCEPKSIKLPESVELFGNLKNGKRFAIDIGCSLTKIAYYSTTKHKQSAQSQRRKSSNSKLSVTNSIGAECQTRESPVCSQNWDKNNKSGNYVRAINSGEGFDNQTEFSHDSTSQKCSQKSCEVEQMSRLHFIKFQTKYIENCLDFIENHIVGNKELVKGNTIKVTGGGVCKYAGCIKEKLGVLIDTEDEICCLIKGTNFLLRNVAKEAFSYQQNGNPEYVFQSVDSDFHPYLLVNIGSGVSIIKVTDEDRYERIGGLSIGGATFSGLGSLLTSAKDYDDLLELAENGDYRKVDVLVRDLIENDYAVTSVSGDLIAASFGKINFTNGESGQKKFSEADIARSLLFTVLNSIGQVASLYATMHNVNKVYFGGYFLRNNPLNMEVLSRSVNYWGDNKIRALFLRHEGYLGTVGAFLKGAEHWQKESSIYGGSKYFSSDGVGSSNQSSVNCNDDQFSVCPLLLDPETYCPDTEDLTKDEEAREYWLQCFEETVEKFAKKAVESQPGNPSAASRAESFKEKFLVRLREWKTNPKIYGALSVRSILDSIELFLHEFDFPDPYLKQKELENENAISLFAEHIRKIDELDSETRLRKLIMYLLAGNMFDWGAKEVAALLETNNFGFDEALEKIPQRPWLIDSLDEWIKRLEGPPHKCATVFVDNSGLDIILGILPFIRELLRRGTEVILCSNSAPALNDVIHRELLVVLDRIKCICPIIREAEETGRLIAMESGQTGPCLDLRRLKKSLCEEMTRRQVDLVVIEGMGRSVHTNLNTFFKCESLKVAVIKNRWLARRLGGTMFCILCQYRNGST
ncbi:hypothetical protein RUM44_012769 [Polyplax serrata]|uniref:4'-phosphopantetheine phosphatase n=1 Tax=Polyplax serrata TaxID=468196 RepID=A0ABR1BC97_POLSC